MSRDCLLRTLRLSLLCFAVPATAAVAQVSVPEAPPHDAKMLSFRDSHYGVRFRVPVGWTESRRDGEVGTFHLDARTASPHAEMRSVLAIQFNPYPYSTFSGARFYYSVERHATDAGCAKEATGPAPQIRDTQDIAGMNFVHGHDESGKICVEARDEVYTAYRKGSCYRFDLAMNTFCSVSSGAVDLTDTQLEQIDRRMTDILSTVKLDWSKGQPHPVPVPRKGNDLEPVPANPRTPLPTTEQGDQ
ncbi:MAG: hypothetical protein ACRYFU_01310 [Janthinobacterium lividum]